VVEEHFLVSVVPSGEQLQHLYSFGQMHAGRRFSPSWCRIDHEIAGLITDWAWLLNGARSWMQPVRPCRKDWSL
jgi:hypothetical protein